MGNSPPVQTPVNFLNGGAAAMFSAQCIKALNDAGYDQNNFGSYDHVNKKIKAAKAKTKAWEEATPAERKAEGLPKPTKEDKYLAGEYHPGENPEFPNACQSGHLTQNGVYQEPGSRGDPCDNFNSVPGHSTNDFPCMPQKGSATQPGGEHNRVSESEKVDAGKNGQTGATYPADQIQKDSDARAKAMANDMTLAKKNGRTPLSDTARAKAAAEEKAVQEANAAKQASDTDGKSVARPDSPYNQPITGKTAGDCINSFRKAGEAAMRDKCIDERATNREAANGGAREAGESVKDYKQRGEDHRAGLENEALAAQDKAEQDPTPENKAAASQAKSDATKARNADCRAQQGDRLAAGRVGNGNGKVPTNAVR